MFLRVLSQLLSLSFWIVASVQNPKVNAHLAPALDALKCAVLSLLSALLRPHALALHAHSL